MYLRAKILTAVGMTRFRRQIANYLARHEDVRYLRIGAGKHTDQGWLATDLIPERWQVAYMDATKPFPLPDRSFDAIVCEHMLEHVPYDAGMKLLAECHRILKVGGVLRIATPDLSVFCDLGSRATRDDDVASYVRWSNSRYDGLSDSTKVSNSAFVVNRMIRAWGHTFIYDEFTLTDALTSAGFGAIRRVAPNQSRRPDLVGVDRHGEEIGELFNEIESLVVEASVEE